jgi:lysophospholipase L1-like esterase
VKINLRSFAIVLFVFISFFSYAQQSNDPSLKFYKANDPKIRYTGRIDFTNPELPRFWAPGVYISFSFIGTTCEIVLNDEELYGTSHNYIEVVVDNNKPYRVQTTGKVNTLKVAENLSNTRHTITICKNTESGIGYLEFAGVKCMRLIQAGATPNRRIEFIGNSITCGAGSDLSTVPCDKGQWYDQHNAYESYGPTTARALNAQWHLSAVSGIGLIRSCCNMTITMPQVFDKVNQRADSIQWNFKKYQPHVVTICLGQNDGVQESDTFTNAYIAFIKKIRSYYPGATIVCLTSPMADPSLLGVMKKNLTAIVDQVNKDGDYKVNKYFFSKRYHQGCGGHPNLAEHKEIADELTAYIKKIKGW